MAKLIEMSRGYCFNTAHIFVDHNIARLASKEVFGEDYAPRWRGEGFYGLTNLVWFLGYYPVTSYYDTEVEDHVPVETDLAKEIGFLLRKDTEKDFENILAWLQQRCKAPDPGMEYDPEKNSIKVQINTRYGSVLWDVRRKDERK